MDDTHISVDPISVSVPEGVRLTGLSRTEIYDGIKRGEIEARKRGTRTLLMFASLRRLIENLPAYDKNNPPAVVRACIEQRRLDAAEGRNPRKRARRDKG
jgi:hypothetical protein